MIFISLFLLIFIYKYMLILLIFIEVIVVNIAFFILIYYRRFNLEFYILYYLIFRVCESVLGIGLLVIIVRYYGNDLYFIFNIRKF